MPNNPAYLKNNAVEIVAILDRSGSMAPLANDAIGGFNRFLSEQQEAPGEANLTLVLFDHEFDRVLDSVPIKDVKKLDHKTYEPRGTTALNDAVGRSINALLKRDPLKAIVVVVTDGYENASKEFKASDVRALMDKVREKGWELVFLAANQDAFATGADYGFKASTTANFAADAIGTRSAFSTANTSTLNYRATGSAEVPQLGSDKK